jgi:hypothetical protein
VVGAPVFSMTAGTAARGEPPLLRLGKVFEERFQAGFLSTGGSEDDIAVVPQCRVVRSRGTERSQMLDSGGNPTDDPEKHVSLLTLRPIVIRGFGRVDLMVFYIDDDGMPCHVVVEVKNTIWDRIPAGRVVRTLGGHRRQVYGYLEPLEYRARQSELGRPQAIVVYPTRPQDPNVEENILMYLAEYGIQIEFEDELLQEAPKVAVPLRQSALGRQSWLTESPACEVCSTGRVRIRQRPEPKGSADDLIFTHSVSCHGPS